MEAAGREMWLAVRVIVLRVAWRGHGPRVEPLSGDWSFELALSFLVHFVGGKDTLGRRMGDKLYVINGINLGGV